MQVSPVQDAVKNVFMCYVETCSILAVLGLLPKPQKFPDVQLGSYGQAQLKKLWSELGIKEGTFPDKISSFWKGVAVGASTVAAIGVGGPKGWGAAGGALVKGFMSDLGNTGPGEAYAEVWHQAWTPVAVPRDKIGLGNVIVDGLWEDDRFKFKLMVATEHTAMSGAESGGKSSEPDWSKIHLELSHFK
jgi:hypothetical protein